MRLHCRKLREVIKMKRFSRCNGTTKNVENIGVVTYSVLQRSPSATKVYGYACIRWLLRAIVDSFWTFATDHQRVRATSSMNCWRMAQTLMCGSNRMVKVDDIRRSEGSSTVMPSYGVENCLVESVKLEILTHSVEVWSATRGTCRHKHLK